MKSKYTEKYQEQAAEYLEPGEQVLSACIAQPKGRTLAMVGGGGAATEMGHRQQREAAGAAETAGLLVEGPMAIAITDQRVATFKISAPVLGRGGNIKEMLSAIPLTRSTPGSTRSSGCVRRRRSPWAERPWSWSPPPAVSSSTRRSSTPEGAPSGVCTPPRAPAGGGVTAG